MGAKQAQDRERAAAELWAELTRVHGAVRGSLGAYLEGETGLLPEDADLLVLLAQAPEQRMRMVDVSAALRLSKSGVTRLVDRLAEQGLVVRAACPKDRRVIYAGLTQGGPGDGAGRGPGRRGRLGAAAGRPSLARGARGAHRGSPPRRTGRGTDADPRVDRAAIPIDHHGVNHGDHTHTAAEAPEYGPPALDPGTDIGTSTSRSRTWTARSRSTRACSASS